MIFAILILIVVLFLAYRVVDSTVENHHPWQQGFDNLKFSTEEFYKSCEAAIKKREIPGISFSRVQYSEGGILSGNREYLHVVRGEHVYDICAAPFGSGFFVSSWHVDKPDVTKKLLRRIPALAPMTDKKSYYQIDTEAMFKSFVHSGMLEAIDEMTNSKGVRALTELERRMPDTSKK
jgi:hypothetical protein